MILLPLKHYLYWKKWNTFSSEILFFITEVPEGYKEIFYIEEEKRKVSECGNGIIDSDDMLDYNQKTIDLFFASPRRNNLDV